MKRAGSSQVGFARQFLAGYPWQRLEPKPDTVAWADEQSLKDGIRPSAAGIAAELRIVYVPRPRAVIAKQLAPSAEYTAGRFDPVSGDYSSLGKVKTDPTGCWHAVAPSHKHDWVLVLAKQPVLR